MGQAGMEHVESALRVDFQIHEIGGPVDAQGL
jgi:hypothetical protein